MKRRLRRQWKQFKGKSYYNSGGSDKSGPQQERQNRSRSAQNKSRSRLPEKLFVGGLALIILGSLVIFSRTAPTELEIDGLEATQASAIEAKVDDYLSSGLNRIKFFVDEAELVQYVTSNTGLSVFDVTVDNSFLTTSTKIFGTLRQPQAFIKLDNESFKLYDQFGQVYEDGSIAVDSLPEITDLSALSQSNLSSEDSLNLPASTVNFISNLNTLLQQENLVKKPIKVKINDQPRSISWVPDSQPYDVIFLVTRDPLDQVNEYKSMKAYLKRISATPTKYIDLRVSNTAYYQ